MANSESSNHLSHHFAVEQQTDTETRPYATHTAIKTEGENTPTDMAAPTSCLIHNDSQTEGHVTTHVHRVTFSDIPAIVLEEDGQVGHSEPTHTRDTSLSGILRHPVVEQD